MSQVSASSTKVRNVGESNVRGRGTNSFGEGRVASVRCRQQACHLWTEHCKAVSVRDVTNGYEFFPRGRVGSFSSLEWSKATNVKGQHFVRLV